MCSRIRDTSRRTMTKRQNIPPHPILPPPPPDVAGEGRRHEQVRLRVLQRRGVGGKPGQPAVVAGQHRRSLLVEQRVRIRRLCGDKRDRSEPRPQGEFFVCGSPARLLPKTISRFEDHLDIPRGVAVESRDSFESFA